LTRRTRRGGRLDEYRGRIDLDHYRGLAYTFSGQAAELAVRGVTGLRGIEDLELVEHDGAHVCLRAGSRRFDVGVVYEPGALTYLTCSAGALRHPRHYAAEILRESIA
jgi:hypothetical protein